MTEFIIEVVGDAPLMLAKLSTILSSGSIAVWLDTEVDPILHERAAQRFKEEGDDASGAWASLSDATESIRESQGYGAAHPINVRSGELQSYIEDTQGRTVVDPAGATLSYPGDSPTGQVWAKLEGAQLGEGRAPARPVLAVSETDQALVVGSLEAYIRAGVAV